MRFLALVAALLASCLRDPDPYRCDRVGGDRACDSAEGARCVRGYCAARVEASVCPSGLRYTESAATPGTCAPVDADAATDVVTPPEDRPDTSVEDATDVVAPQVDVIDVAIPTDVPIAMDVVDASVRDVVDAPPAVDVPPARDVVDVPPAVDVPTARDVPTTRDVVDVVDAGCPVNARIVSPLPNERHLGRNLTVVTAANEDTTGLVAVLASGIRCDGVQTATTLSAGRAQFSLLGRGYYCVALRQRRGERDCQTPWRRVAVMANNYDNNAARHWGLWPDFNNDGYADLLMATAGGVFVQSFVADGTFVGGSSPARPDDAQSAVALAAVGDVDGDGFGDAAITWALRGGARGVYLHRGGPMGLTAAPTRLVPIAPVTDPSYGEALLALGDRDSDGRTEVGVLTNGRRTLRVAALSAQGAPVEHASLSYPSPMEGLAAGADVTGDNRPDIVLAVAGVVYVHSVGGVVMIPSPSPEHREGFGRALATGSDFDHDGVSEVVISVPSAEEAHIYRYTGASFVPVMTTPIQSLERSAIVAPGDMETVAGDEVVVLNDAEAIRVRRGGFDNDLSFTLRWSAPVGTLIAGTSTMIPTGAFWFPRAAATGGRHGVVIARMAGAALAPQIDDMLFSQPVTLVSP